MRNAVSERRNLATLRQIHSDRCVPAGGQCGCLGEGDALVERAPGTLVGVKTADCIPILLVDAETRSVAAVHAGWRGSANRIAMRAVEAMAREFGTEPGDLHAAIGPGIGLCCYEVGPEVAGRFGMRAAGPVHLDLPGANRGQLLEAGIPPAASTAPNSAPAVIPKIFTLTAAIVTGPDACCRWPVCAEPAGSDKISVFYEIHPDTDRAGISASGPGL